MALKSLYCVCEIKKLDLIFSSFSVRSQNHSYKNSIVFRLARHLCSSTSLVLYHSNVANSTARKLPIQKCMGKIAVQLKSHGESEIARD